MSKWTARYVFGDPHVIYETEKPEDAIYYMMHNIVKAHALANKLNALETENEGLKKGLEIWATTDKAVVVLKLENLKSDLRKIRDEIDLPRGDHTSLAQDWQDKLTALLEKGEK